MKILASVNYNITLNNLYQTMSDMSDFMYWNHNIKSLYDSIFTFKPDVLIINADLLTNINLKVIEEFNINTIVIGECNHFPQHKMSIFLEDMNIKLEDVKYKYYLLKSAISNKIVKENKVKNFNISILYDKKDIDITPIILGLQETKENFVIFGPIKLNIPEYLGIPDMYDVSDILSSSKIVILFNNDFIYDAAIRNCYAITTCANDIYPKVELDNVVEECMENLDITHIINIPNNNSYTDRLNDILRILNNEN